jgi:RHS repeat-associated protein
MRLPLPPPACNFGFVILLAELDASSLAAKKKRQLAPLKLATSTPKNRVWGFEKTPSGRLNIEAGSSWENATGSVQYTYRNASGRAEWLSRDPLPDAERRLGPNLYEYVYNDPINGIDPAGEATFQIGFSGNVNLGIVNFNLSGGIAVDTSGNVALYSAPGAGAGLGGDAGAGVSVAVSDAATVDDLGGVFGNASISGGLGFDGSVDAFGGPSANGPVVGAGITLGVGAGADVALTATDTKLTPLNYKSKCP